MEILKTSALSIGYDDKTVVSNINVTLNEGDIIALVGPNGAGKSTLFKTFSTHIKPVGGKIELFGKDLISYSPKERAKLLGIVLTERPDDMFLKVFDVVAAGRYPYTGMFGKLSEKDENEIKVSLELVGVNHLIDRVFNTLSDGEKQKVMIAKAIAQNTPVIMLDEPTAFLDYPSKIELFSLLKKLAKEQGKAILFSSHDLELLLRYTDNLWIIAKNKPFAAGQSSELLKNGTIQKYFACRRRRLKTRHRHLLCRRQRFCRVGTQIRRGWLPRSGQLLAVAHGPYQEAGSPRDQRRCPHRRRYDYRQPQLLYHPDGTGAGTPARAL